MQASFGTYEGTIASDKAAIKNAELNLTTAISSRRSTDAWACARSIPATMYRGRRHCHAGNHAASSHCGGLYHPGRSGAGVAQHMKTGTLEVDAYSRDDQTKLARASWRPSTTRSTRPRVRCS